MLMTQRVRHGFRDIRSDLNGTMPQQPFPFSKYILQIATPFKLN